MQPTKILKVVLRKEPFTVNLGVCVCVCRGMVGILLLSKYHHNVNLIAREDLLLNEGVLPTFVDALHHHAQWIDSRFAIVIGSSWCSSMSVLASFSHRCQLRRAEVMLQYHVDVMPHILHLFSQKTDSTTNCTHIPRSRSINKCSAGLTIFHEIFSILDRTRGIFHRTLSLPHTVNTLMDLNNVMFTHGWPNKP